MAPTRPSLTLQFPVAPSSYVQPAGLERRPGSFSHISSFRSLLLDMQIYSSSIKPVKYPRLECSDSYPVFGDQDKIEGKVKLDPSCSRSGRLTISLEGTFEYSSVDWDDGPRPIRRHRHVFLSTSTVTPVSSPSESRSTFREAFSVRKRPSASSLNSPGYRSCEFSFELPRGSRPGEEIPSTFSSKIPSGNSAHSPMDEFEISYRITAVWEASDGFENRAILEAPVLFQPDTDFQSADGSVAKAKLGSWLEMPLIPDRPIPFSCAVTLPHIQSFSRCSSIPFFVVFSTNIRSQTLIKEIAADATIAVSLIRQINTYPQRNTQSPTPPESPSVSDESDGRASPFASRSRLLKRSLRTLTRSQEFNRTNKPLPVLPQEAFSSSQTLQTRVSIGFPKRPRTNNVQGNLPDGLYKGRMQLSRDMLPSINWPGITVKYYLDVSVLVGQDDLRAHIPIQIY